MGLACLCCVVIPLILTVFVVLILSQIGRDYPGASLAVLCYAQDITVVETFKSLIIGDENAPGAPKINWNQWKDVSLSPSPLNVVSHPFCFPFCQTSFLENPLTVIGGSGDGASKEMVNYLYTRGVLIDDGRFSTPLMSCITASVDMDFAKFLIDHGANVNQLRSETTPLVTAIKTGKIEWVQLLVEYGKADVNQPVGVSLAVIEYFRV